MWFLSLLLLAIYALVMFRLRSHLLLLSLAYGAVASCIIVCVRCFIALGSTWLWGTGAVNDTRGPEPAYYNYFCDKAWRDYAMFVVDARDMIFSDAAWVLRGGRGMARSIVWFLGITVWLWFGLCAVPAAVLAIILGVIPLLMLAVASAFVYVCGALLYVVEFCVRKAKRIRGRCPECHMDFRIPVYVCACGARHRNLVPGRYGPLLRRCRCGQELATMLQFGRNRLTSLCPHCDHALNTTILTVRDLFIPIVGGVSSGKSSLVVASLLEFERKSSGLALSFPVANGQDIANDRRDYESARIRYLAGQSMAKTTDAQVRATQVCLEDSRGHRRLLYLYDAAGEIFGGDHPLGRLPYYSNVHGIVFLIDPLPLMATGASAAGPFGSRRSAVAAADLPQDIYDRVVQALIGYSGSRGIRGIPLAILITKSDTPGLRDQMLTTPVPPATGKKLPDADEQRSLAIRQWLLESSAGSVVRSAEMYFHHVRYFECSALGRSPGGSIQPFRAHGLMAPWAWLLRNSGMSLNLNSENPTA